MQERLKKPTFADALGVAATYSVCVYGAFLSAVLPLLFRNNYIDINTYKYLAFTTATYVAFAAFISLLAVRFPVAHFRPPNDKIAFRIRVIGWAMLAFLLINAVACFLSENPELSFAGLPGRRTGLNFLICAFMMYIMFRFAKGAAPFVLNGLVLSGALTSLLAVINFLGFDPLRMYVNLVQPEHEMFLSTIGNRNFFGGFLSISLAMAGAKFIFGEGKWSFLYLPGAFLGFAALIAGRSDLAFAGVGAGMIALLFMSLKDARAFSRFLALAATAAAAALSLKLLYNVYSGQSLFIYPSFAKSLLTWRGAEFALSACGFAALACAFFVRKYAGVRPLALIRRVSAIAIAALTALALGLLLYFTISGKTPPVMPDLLRFDDHFGNFRGYIWIRAARIFGGLPPLNQLIGLGPDMFARHALLAYRDEMVAVTRAPFDNCHNEYLQYLLTSGILGLGAYLTAMSASFHALIRRVRAGEFGAAPPVLAALSAYAAQSFFNVNQPMTTLFSFLLMALAFRESRITAQTQS